jgi:hypothetical protein
MSKADHRVINVRAGNVRESWLVVYADGRIQYHEENNGHRFMNRGPEPINEWIDLGEVAQLEQRHCKSLVAEVLKIRKELAST